MAERKKTQKKYTAVYYTEEHMEYVREERYSNLIGYCARHPKQVLRALFAEFDVVEYKGEELGKGPGLSIHEIEPVFGIEGTISRLLKNKEILESKRIQKLPPVVITNMICYTKQVLNFTFLKGTPRYETRKQTLTELVDVLNGFNHT